MKSAFQSYQNLWIQRFYRASYEIHLIQLLNSIWKFSPKTCKFSPKFEFSSEISLKMTSFRDFIPILRELGFSDSLIEVFLNSSLRYFWLNSEIFYNPIFFSVPKIFSGDDSATQQTHVYVIISGFNSCCGHCRTLHRWVYFKSDVHNTKSIICY